MKYTCPKVGCPFTSIEHDNIYEILEHEKTHPKAETSIGLRVIKTPCEHCNENGYIEQTHMVDVPNVPKTD